MSILTFLIKGIIASAIHQNQQQKAQSENFKRLANYQRNSVVNKKQNIVDEDILRFNEYINSFCHQSGSHRKYGNSNRFLYCSLPCGVVILYDTISYYLTIEKTANIEGITEDTIISEIFSDFPHAEQLSFHIGDNKICVALPPSLSQDKTLVKKIISVLREKP